MGGLTPAGCDPGRDVLHVGAEVVYGRVTTRRSVMIIRKRTAEELSRRTEDFWWERRPRCIIGVGAGLGHVLADAIGYDVDDVGGRVSARDMDYGKGYRGQEKEASCGEDEESARAGTEGPKTVEEDEAEGEVR